MTRQNQTVAAEHLH